jgi:hypothetical protein
MQPAISTPPATSYQWLTLLFRILAQSANEAPALTLLSRALGKTDSFAHEVLRQLLHRGDLPHGRRASTGSSARQVLRWFLPREDARHPGDAHARLDWLMASFRTPMEAFEMLVCFHFAMASCDPPAREELVRDVLDWIAREPRTVRCRRLKGLLQHAMVDAALNLADELAKPAVAESYDDADLIFNMATSLEAAGAPHDGVLRRLIDLRGRSREIFALCSYLLTVRLGSLPGLAFGGRMYLDYLRDHYGEELRRAPAQPLAKCAAEFDYSEDLAGILERRGDCEVDLLALFEQTLSLVARGALRRRRTDEDARTRWSKEEVRVAARRFQAWSLTHEICRLMAPSFDVRAPATSLTDNMARLATLAMSRPLDEALGGMFVNELYVIE